MRVNINSFWNALQSLILGTLLYMLHFKHYNDIHFVQEIFLGSVCFFVAIKSKEEVLQKIIFLILLSLQLILIDNQEIILSAQQNIYIQNFDVNVVGVIKNSIVLFIFFLKPAVTQNTTFEHTSLLIFTLFIGNVATFHDITTNGMLRVLIAYSVFSFFLYNKRNLDTYIYRLMLITILITKTYDITVSILVLGAILGIFHNKKLSPDVLRISLILELMLLVYLGLFQIEPKDYPILAYTLLSRAFIRKSHKNQHFKSTSNRSYNILGLIFNILKVHLFYVALKIKKKLKVHRPTLVEGIDQSITLITLYIIVLIGYLIAK